MNGIYEPDSAPHAHRLLRGISEHLNVLREFCAESPGLESSSELDQWYACILTICGHSTGISE